MTRLMERICKGALGYELVARGFTLYELDDHSICLEHKSGNKWFFTVHSTITSIRETALEYLKERNKI